MSIPINQASNLMDALDNYKACVIGFDDDGTYSIFSVDFANDVAPASTIIDGFIEKRPILQIKDVSLCFCVLGSSLFMFDASGNLRAGSGKKWTYKLDLHRSKSADSVLNSYTIKEYRGPDMHSPKCCPQAIPTPDGKKILVFSGLLSYYPTRYACFYDNDKKRRCDFEVFDPSKGSWDAIPNLVIRADSRANPKSMDVRDEESGMWIEHRGRKDLAPFLDHGSSFGWADCDFAFRERFVSSSFRIQACFINNNTFIVGFPMGVVFAYNLDLPLEGWKEYTDECAARANWYDFLFVDGVRMNPFGISNGVVDHMFGITEYFQKPSDNLSYLITMLEYFEDSKCCIPCILSSGRCTTSGHPYFVCHLFKVDMTMVARPLRLSSFKYMVPESKSIPGFMVTDVFPMMDHRIEKEGTSKESALLTESREKDQRKHAKTT